MFKKSLLALSVCLSGATFAATNNLDDVTMTILEEGAFQDLVGREALQVERVVGSPGEPMRTRQFTTSDGSVPTLIDGVSPGKVFVFRGSNLECAEQPCTIGSGIGEVVPGDHQGILLEGSALPPGNVVAPEGGAMASPVRVPVN